MHCFCTRETYTTWSSHADDGDDDDDGDGDGDIDDQDDDDDDDDDELLSYQNCISDVKAMEDSSRSSRRSLFIMNNELHLKCLVYRSISKSNK